MSTGSRPLPASDEAILRERERADQAVLRMLASWCEPGEQAEQRDALDELKRALDEDRPVGRKLFPGP